MVSNANCAYGTASAVPSDVAKQEQSSQLQDTQPISGELTEEAPYTNYTPLPGVIPPTEAPQFPSAW